MTTKDHVKLIKRIEAHLVTLGAVKTPDGIYEWSLATPLGDLGIKLNETFQKRGVMTIFTCFNHQAPVPLLAMKRFPHEVNVSGKWNFHFDMKSCTVESIFAVFAADLARTRDERTMALVTAHWQPPRPAA